jgi:hypothetical protein
MSDAPKHTPGPWVIDREVRPEYVCSIHHVPEDGEGRKYLFVRGKLGHWPGDPIENMANARLIAAAPDMLEALKECAEYIETDAHPNFYREETVDLIYSKALEAIAKAEGGSHE